MQGFNILLNDGGCFIGLYFAYVVFLRDLLSKDGEKLDIKINPDGTGQLHVPGLRVIEVKSFQHIKKVTDADPVCFRQSILITLKVTLKQT